MPELPSLVLRGQKSEENPDSPNGTKQCFAKYGPQYPGLSSPEDWTTHTQP